MVNCSQGFLIHRTYVYIYIQTDTTVLNLVISPELECGQIHFNVVKAFDPHKFKLTQEEDLLEQKYFAGSMPLLTHNHSSWTCGGPEVLTSTTIIKKCGVRTSSGD